VRPLRVGYSWGAAGKNTNALLRQWRSSHPDVELQVLRCDDRTAGLASGAVDLAFVRVRLALAHIVSVELFHEPRFLAIADDHPLARRKRVSLRDLRGDTLAISSETGATSLDLWPAGQAPAVVIDVGNVDEWLTAIGSGQAIGVTSASTLHQHPRAGIVFVPIGDAPPVTTSVAYNDTRVHPRQAEFIALAHRVVRARPHRRPA
jgi:DNA-binding transcriptional LysR family regulator